MRVPCESCGRKMSARAVVCPFCDVRQNARDLIEERQPEREDKGLAGVPLTKDEVSALLLATDMASPRSAAGDQPGLFAGLMLPRPDAHGVALVVDVLLIMLSLPLTMGAVAVTMLSRGARRLAGYPRSVATSPIAAALIGLVIGGPGAYALLTLLDASPAVRWTVLGVSAAALFIRTVLRIR